MKVTRVLGFLFLAVVGCDDEPPAGKAASSASAIASAPPPPEAKAPPPAPPAETASAAPASSAPTKDAVVSVFDPAKDKEKTVKALANGSVSLYLPEWAGTTWKIAQPDKALGKVKEETIPGFAGPSTPAHAFTWQIKPTLKGQMHKVTLTNAGKGSTPVETTFTLSIDVS